MGHSSGKYQVRMSVAFLANMGHIVSDVCCILSGEECVREQIDKQEVGRQLACEVVR